MVKAKMEIIEVSHGIANRFGDGTIEVNKHLRAYPKLYYPIIKHELEHTDSLGFTLKDLRHDINANHEVNQIQLLKFMFKHPKSFSQFLPFYYTKKRKFVVDINLCIIYFVMVLIAIGIRFFIF